MSIIYKPYELTFDYDTPKNNWAVYSPKNISTNPYMLMEGVQLPSANIGNLFLSQDPATYDFVFETTGSEEVITSLDILPTNAPFPIVNGQVKNILEQICPIEIQFFPLEIQNTSNKKDFFKIKNKYWALNILKLVNAIDIQKSEVVLDKNDEIILVNKLVFKEIKYIEDSFTVAREKSFKSLILVSPQLKEAFEKHKIKGCEFLTDEEYNRLSF